jgi:ElaB/YqjD/DUF883 family membrane-anchored ribosome-binding protein
MANDTSPGATSNGEQAKQEFRGAKDHLKAAANATAEELRGRAQQYGDRARERAGEAGDWAKSQWSGIQGRVESQPQTAAIWALGIGVVAGILLGAAFRGRD